MNYIEVLGYVAGILVVVASLPQIIKIIESKSTSSISLWMYVVLTTGTALWVVYGLLTKQTPITAPNVIFLVFNLIILGLKIKYK